MSTSDSILRALSTGMSVAGSEIETLMRVLDARNEFELAAKLGLTRSAVSQWKRRGMVPGRLRHLLTSDGDDVYLEASRQQIFRRPEYHYWLRAALVLAPATEAGALSDPAGLRREWLIVNLMALAMRVTRKDLGLSRITSEAVWARLMDRLRSECGGEIQDIVAKAGG
jgi:hypothetical protein